MRFLDEGRDGSDTEVLLIIADNGIGLPADWETKQSQSLGLNLVQILVRQLHGTLKIENENGVSYKILFKQKMKNISVIKKNKEGQNGSN